MIKQIKEGLIFHYESMIYLMVALLGLKVIYGFATWGEEFYMPFQGITTFYEWAFFSIPFGGMLFLVSLFRLGLEPVPQQPRKEDSPITVLLCWFLMMAIIIVMGFNALGFWDPTGVQRQGGRILLKQ